MFAGEGKQYKKEGLRTEMYFKKRIRDVYKRQARKGLKVAIIAERIGGQVNETMGIENLISVVRRISMTF